MMVYINFLFQIGNLILESLHDNIYYTCSVITNLVSIFVSTIWAAASSKGEPENFLRKFDQCNTILKKEV